MRVCVRALPDCAACLHVHAALVISCFEVCRSLLRQNEDQSALRLLVCPVLLCACTQGSCSGTPVWQRLRQQCSNSRDCLLVMLQQRDEQLAAARAALEAAEARAAAAVEARAAGAAGMAVDGCTTSFA